MHSVLSKKSYSSMVSMQNKKKTIIIAMVTILAIAILLLLDIYKCPLNYVLGIPCPMCGMTRAVLSALSGNFADAFHYHPLWIIILLGIIFIVLYELKVIRIPKALFNVICVILGILLIVCYIYRLIIHSEVVMPHFTSSLIYKLFSGFLSL